MIHAPMIRIANLDYVHLKAYVPAWLLVQFVPMQHLTIAAVDHVPTVRVVYLLEQPARAQIINVQPDCFA